MHEILRNLPDRSRVLDLGSGAGSVGADCYPKIAITRLDAERPAASAGEGFVQALAGRLPFPDRIFDAVIANHSLEHMDALTRVLQEIRRVLRPDGNLYVAVPDASTFTDRVYRWLYHGGGHINLFKSAEEVSHYISRATGLRLTAVRVLHSSLIFLQPNHFNPRPPRKLCFFCNGNPNVIAILNYTLRSIDRFFQTRTSV